MQRKGALTQYQRQLGNDICHDYHVMKSSLVKINSLRSAENDSFENGILNIS